MCFCLITWITQNVRWFSLLSVNIHVVMWTLAWARVHTYSGNTTCCDWLSGWLAGWLLLPTSRHNMSANGSILRFVFRGVELLKKPIGIPTLRLLCVFFAQAGTEVTNAMRTELENFQRYDFLFALSLRWGCTSLPAMSTGGSTLRFASCGFAQTGIEETTKS